MIRFFRSVSSSVLLGTVAILSLCTFARAGGTYFPDTSVDLVRYLAPPPQAQSDANRAEIVQLLRLQSTRTPTEVAYAQADQKISVFRFADSLDTAVFKESHLPITARFFAKTLETANGISEIAKKSFARPRPFTTDSAIHPVLGKPTNASYPSGHSLSGNLIAILLADIVPERKPQIFQRGWVFAENRAIGGVHYPSDLQAGRICAALIAQRLYQDPQFRKDLDSSRTEIRKTLNLAK
jgi:acid phosphatase (class A)